MTLEQLLAAIDATIKKTDAAILAHKDDETKFAFENNHRLEALISRRSRLRTAVGVILQHQEEFNVLRDTIRRA